MESEQDLLAAEHAGHELKDANVRPIVIVLAGLAVSVAMVGLLVYGIFWYMADHPVNTARPNPMAEPVQLPPPPRIDTIPGSELKKLHTYEDEILSTYGWTDPNKGIVRIPIDQAMQMELERGFPTSPAAAATGAAKTGAVKK